MADLARYAEVVKRIIGEYAAIKPAYGGDRCIHDPVFMRVRDILLT